jgi:hypothetical protein
VGLFGNKFNKLKREDIKNCLLSLQEQEEELDKGLETKKDDIDKLMERGKKETDRVMKLRYAKKINDLKAERESDLQRVMFVSYNIKLMNQLMVAVEDKNFIASVGKVPLNKMLKDQKSLAKFLNKSLNKKVKTEDIMTQADETFQDVKFAYEPNQTIFGTNKNDDELLAMFETEASLEEQTESAVIENNQKSAQAQ